MEWRKRSELDEHYCAVHNVDCPLQDHSGDPMVLHINPMRHPSAWVCPQAVLEMEHHLDEAAKYRDENDGEPAGLVLDEDEEQLLIRVADAAGYDDIRDTATHSGAESLTLEQLDGVHYAINEHGDEVDGDTESLQAKVAEHWEEHANET